MAAPRVKRPFAGAASDPTQRQITNFFARDETFDAFTTTADRSSTSSYELSAPLLPPSVQANLLAVGMRVRKSVPEGYKTGKDVDDSDSSIRTVPTRRSQANPFVSSYSSFLRSNVATEPSAPPARRELLPFCGIHKVGGLGVQSFADDDQPLFAASVFRTEAMEAATEDSEPPSLTSSQETVSSTASSYETNDTYHQPPSQQSRFASRLTAPPTRKRGYGGHEDGNEEYEYHGNSSVRIHEDGEVSLYSAASPNGWLADGEISPKTVAPHGLQPGATYYQLGRRVLAMPKRRQQRTHSLYQQQPGHESPRELRAPSKPDTYGLHSPDQENADVMGGGDFGEADFLDANMLID